MKTKYCCLSLNIISIILMVCSLQCGTVGAGGNKPWTVFEKSPVITILNLALIFINLFGSFLLFSNCKTSNNIELNKNFKIILLVTNILSILLIIIGFCINF